MITRDEEQWLPQCIASVRDIVSEIIIVDTGSVDRTPEIARALGASVHYQPWENDFAKPRNLSLKHANCDWILVLDADEVINPADHERLQDLCRDSSKCYLLTQRHYSADHRLSNYLPVTGEYPQWEKHYPGYFESSLVRLFPNHCGIEYRGRIHELVEHSISEFRNLTIIKPGL
jgi:glycosyltransferase involved in cell wall biosynthesis